jgi:hypothetical protein
MGFFLVKNGLFYGFFMGLSEVGRAVGFAQYGYAAPIFLIKYNLFGLFNII